MCIVCCSASGGPRKPRIAADSGSPEPEPKPTFEKIPAVLLLHGKPTPNELGVVQIKGDTDEAEASGVGCNGALSWSIDLSRAIILILILVIAEYSTFILRKWVWYIVVACIVNSQTQSESV